MRLRRKDVATTSQSEVADESTSAAAEPRARGPRSVEELDSVEGYVDFGALLIPASEFELRLNVDESTGRIMSLAWLQEDGGLEVSVFAAPRTSGAWDELRPELEADATQRGGTVETVEGPYGAEVLCALPVQLPDGTGALQRTRIFAFQGDRWLLRGALVGRPVDDPENAEQWYAVFDGVVVRRGGEARPVGEALDLQLPPQIQLTDPQGGHTHG